MKTSKDCKVCRGSKHRFDKQRGKFVACECLKKKRSADRYTKAGIGVRFRSVTWKNLKESYRVQGLASLLGVAKKLQVGDREAPWVMLHGRPAKARQIAAALTARAACDGGLTAAMFDLPTLIDIEFNRGEATDDIYKVDAAVVEVGGEPSHKFNRHVFERLIRTRWNTDRFTMLVVDGPPGRLGTKYGSQALSESFKEKFKRVKVEPNE